MFPTSRRVALQAGLAWLCAGVVLTTPARADVLGDAKALSQKAAVLIIAEGERAFPTLSDPKGEFVQGNLYVVVLDQHGILRAHLNPKLVGMDMWEQADPDGVNFVQDAVKIAAGAGSGWQTYKYVNPASKKIEHKKAWVQKAGEFVVVCGAYVSD